jgi:type 1 glutamine amidotransferase
MKKALIVWGGWNGHEPEQCAGIAANLLKKEGFELEISATLEQMLSMGVRIEQQAFAKHGLNYVLDKYLPAKIKKGKYLP